MDFASCSSAQSTELSIISVIITIKLVEAISEGLVIIFGYAYSLN